MCLTQVAYTVAQHKFDGATSWIRANGTVDFSSLGQFIGRCGDDSTRIPLMKLRDVLVITDEQKRVEVSE